MGPTQVCWQEGGFELVLESGLSDLKIMCTKIPWKLHIFWYFPCSLFASWNTYLTFTFILFWRVQWTQWFSLYLCTRSIFMGRLLPFMSPFTRAPPLPHQPGPKLGPKRLLGAVASWGFWRGPSRPLDAWERRTLWWASRRFSSPTESSRRVQCWIWHPCCVVPPPSTSFSFATGWQRHGCERRRSSRCLPHRPAALPLGRPGDERLWAHGGRAQISDGGTVWSVGSSTPSVSAGCHAAAAP